MRIFAIGDIHGCSIALNALLEIIQPASSDLLITLGDYVHRGPDSLGVLDRLINLHASSRLIALCGNHEQMLLQGEDDENLALTPAHMQFLNECLVDWHEIETHFFVHANAYPDYALAEQPVSMLRWEHLWDPAPHESGKVMICGHTPQRNGMPLNLGHTICIDTFPYGTGRLTCLDVESGQYWQSDQRTNVRSGWIDEV
jgi:serine/threonine protein phosphatase 1